MHDIPNWRYLNPTMIKNMLSEWVCDQLIIDDNKFKMPTEVPDGQYSIVINNILSALHTISVIEGSRKTKIAIEHRRRALTNVMNKEVDDGH